MTLFLTKETYYYIPRTFWRINVNISGHQEVPNFLTCSRSINNFYFHSNVKGKSGSYIFRSYIRWRWVGLFLFLSLFAISTLKRTWIFSQLQCSFGFKVPHCSGTLYFIELMTPFCVPGEFDHSSLVIFKID